MVRRKDTKKSRQKGSSSLNEEDYFARLNEEALKKIKGSDDKKEKPEKK
jgi:hypothetical protein